MPTGRPKPTVGSTSHRIRIRIQSTRPSSTTVNERAPHRTARFRRRKRTRVSAYPRIPVALCRTRRDRIEDVLNRRGCRFVDRTDVIGSGFRITTRQTVPPPTRPGAPDPTPLSNEKLTVRSFRSIDASMTSVDASMRAFFLFVCSFVRVSAPIRCGASAVGWVRLHAIHSCRRCRKKRTF